VEEYEKQMELGASVRIMELQAMDQVEEVWATWDGTKKRIHFVVRCPQLDAARTENTGKAN